MEFPPLRLAILCLLAAVASGQEEPVGDLPAPRYPVLVDSVLEAQVELHRRGFSCGPIDGLFGPQTAAALRAWQRSTGISETGWLEAATRDRLRLTAPALGDHLVASADVEELQPVPTTWLGRAERSALGYATTLEAIAERYRSGQRHLRRLNPEVDWDALQPGMRVIVPDVGPVTIARPAVRLRIRLAPRELVVLNVDGRTVARFPVSIARRVEKRPVGELRVTAVIPDPNFTFDPELFPESVEGRELGRRLVLPPGPNNPVGLAWIGLDRPGYGIHGTPEPENIGRTESHGCFRLANWDAVTLLDLAWVGMPVAVEL